MNTFPLFTLIPERSLEVSHYKELQDSTFPYTEPHAQSHLKSIYLLINTPAAATAAKSLQSCPTLCDPIDSSLLGSSVPGILQARTLEWAAISFSNAWKSKVKVKSLSRVWLFETPWTAA